MNWKKWGKHLLFPHPVLAALLGITAAVLLAYSFVALETTDLLSIVAYVLSFYALVLVCVRTPQMVRWFVRFRTENRYYLRYRTDIQLRVNLSLYGMVVFNSAYALFQLCLGLKHHSAWFYAMAGYYLLLALIGVMLVRYTRQHVPGEEAELEWHKYRLCGVCLLIMNLALAVFTLYFVFRIRIFVHHEITTIAMAVYTFAALTMAIINVIRYRKYHSPAYSAVRDTSLVCAAVSILTLENAMLTAFGRESGEMFRQIMLGATGVAVICFVQGIALYMIISATKQLKQLTEEKTNGK